MFPFSIAKKLPVYVYERVKFSNLSGEIVIDAPVKRGMIGIGQRFERMTRSKNTSEIHLLGKWVFRGHAYFGKDCHIFIGKDAYCEFGDMATLGSDVKLICTHKITLGAWTGIGYESQLVDSTLHPFKNTETGALYPLKSPIELGACNAVSNRVSFMPGTKTPDNIVVASNSLCNKDYTSWGSEVLIGGIPAQLIKTNFARDWENEKELLKKYKIVKW